MALFTGIFTGVESGTSPASGQPDYWTSVYGDSTIDWVPPVINYNYNENIPRRGPNDGFFRWEEVEIDLGEVMTGALLEFVMPDMYTIQVTPDLGWQDPLAMFGDDSDAGVYNPHLETLGLYSIEQGTLTDNGDGTVTASGSFEQMWTGATEGFGPHLWRAVPWANGNPGLGGFPQRFEYISDESQLDFSIDEIIKETKHPNQSISGRKSNRSTITIEDQNNPQVFVEQNNTSWRIWFTIDRRDIQFRIVASDDGGGVVGYHQVNLTYESFSQHDGHIWNAFDGFGLFASIKRLPGETNYSLKQRVIDAYTNKGGSHYDGLIKGINRQLGIARYDEALSFSRDNNAAGQPVEDFVTVTTTHTRLSVFAPSFIQNEEVYGLNPFDNILFTTYRINEVIAITTERGVDIPEKDWELLENVGGNEIRFADHISGMIKITYSYLIDLLYEDYVTLYDLVIGINAITGSGGSPILTAEISTEMSGTEPSNRLFHSRVPLSIDSLTATIGWSPVKLSSVSDQEWKESFRDEDLMYFGSSFYRYIKELKSQTNVEWGFVISDKDIWDAVGSEGYGNTHLELVYDVPLSNWKLTVPIGGKEKFDPWEAFRVGFYYDGTLIKNAGLDKRLFRSGVGFIKDCIVSLSFSNVTSADGQINLNPFISLPDNTIDIDNDLIQEIILDI